MRILVASDSYGASLAGAVAQHLRETHPDIELRERGTHKYYEAAHNVAGEVEAAAAAGRQDVRAVLCCGSGQGVCIVANKWPHVYAALCTTPEAATGCRSVNNANVLCMGGRVTSAKDGCKIVDAWLGAEVGEGLAEPVAAFVRRSMTDIPALDFSPQAAQQAAATAAAVEQQ